MSFQISDHGTRSGVKKFIAEFKPTAPDTDQAQLDAVKAVLISEIDALPKEFNGCRVNCEGQSHAGARTLSYNIIPLKLRLDA